MKARYLAVISCMAFSSNILANESSILFGVELGASSVDFDEDTNLLVEDYDDDGLGFTYSLGYRWENNAIVEISGSFASNNAFFESFDFYETTEYQLLVGYSFPVSEKFRVVPMVGLSNWDLDSKEGTFLNPGDEVRQTFSGTDVAYKISAEYALFSSVVLSLSYRSSALDIGTSSMTQLGLKMAF